MNDATLLLRQVHPSWVRGDRATSQAFTPTPKDDHRLSVYDGDQISAEASWGHFTSVLRLASAGVLAVTVGECTEQGCAAASDPVSFPEHVLIDFEPLSRSRVRSVGKALARCANERGWQYRPEAS